MKLVLTILVFLGLKLKELSIFLAWCIGFILTSVLLCGIFMGIGYIISIPLGNTDSELMLVFGVFTTTGIGMFILLIANIKNMFIGIIDFFKSNWKQANQITSKWQG